MGLSSNPSPIGNNLCIVLSGDVAGLVQSTTQRNSLYRVWGGDILDVSSSPAHRNYFDYGLGVETFWACPVLQAP